MGGVGGLYLKVSSFGACVRRFCAAQEIREGETGSDKAARIAAAAAAAAAAAVKTQKKESASARTASPP